VLRATRSAQLSRTSSHAYERISRHHSLRRPNLWRSSVLIARLPHYNAPYPLRPEHTLHTRAAARKQNLNDHSTANAEIDNWFTRGRESDYKFLLLSSAGANSCVRGRRFYRNKYRESRVETENSRQNILVPTKFDCGNSTAKNVIFFVFRSAECRESSIGTAVVCLL